MKQITRPAMLPESRLASIDAYEYTDLPKLEQLVEYGIHKSDYHRRRSRPPVISDFATFDIETTTVSEESKYNPDIWPYAVPYLYQFYLFGRVWLMRSDAEFAHFIETLEFYCEKYNFCLVVYVHNLSYEYQFLRSRIPLNFQSVFALQSRRIGKFETAAGFLEFRCSYLLSNMSLEKFTENFCSEEYRKDKELIDYELLRWPWDELSNEILYYGAMDVITLYHAVKTLMEKENDTIRTIPLTNTGYVRRHCRDACLGENYRDYKSEEGKKTYWKFKNYHKMIRKCAPDLDQYNQLVDAFRGGNTHANRFRAGQILENVASADFGSSYPAVLIAYDGFPMGKLMDCTKSVQDPAKLDYYIKHYWLCITVVFKDIRLRNMTKTVCPYISLSKTRHEKIQGIYDNGRIMEQPGFTEFTFLGIEWDIIRKQYTGQYKIIKATYAVPGYLPTPLRAAIFDFYKAKTELKGVDDKEYEYMKSKNRVNAGFGMMVEKPIKNVIEVSGTGQIRERKPTTEEAEEMLTDYTAPKNRKFLLYQWGVTITAIARVRHMEIIDIVGDDFVYGDTDSVKYLNPEKYAAEFDRYNQIWVRYASQCGVGISAITKKGDVQTLGVLDQEKTAKRFVTLGAKKYVYEDQDDKLHITIAGVPKEQGAAMLGCLENFKPGFVFRVPDDADLEDRQRWKKMLTYRDDLNEDFEIDGHALHLGTCIAMTRTEYELDITPEYSMLTGFNDRYEADPEIWQ